MCKQIKLRQSLLPQHCRPRLRAVNCLQNLLRDRLPLFPNLVCLYLNRPTSEVRGAFQEQVLQTLKSHQPEAQVDIMDVEVPEPFDDAYLGDWEL